MDTCPSMVDSLISKNSHLVRQNEQLINLQCNHLLVNLNVDVMVNEEAGSACFS